MKVGINGFGRIGKTVYKILSDRDITVTQINDPFIELNYLRYLLQFDSTHGETQNVSICDNKLKYKNNTTELLNFKNPADIPWDVDIVIESSGAFTTIDLCNDHKVDKILITSPSKDVPMFVYGVNHTKYNNERIVSNASCTTNCLAPIAKVINDAFTIKEGLMTTIHSVTASQKIVDGLSNKCWRSGRGALQNIIPASTGAASAVSKVIPTLEGKLTGISMRVPVANVSVVDFTFKTEIETSFDEIIKELQKAAAGEMKGILATTDLSVVSSDFISCSLSACVDLTASIALNSTFYKIIAWYDNEYGYSCRIVDLLVYIMSKADAKA